VPTQIEDKDILDLLATPVSAKSAKKKNKKVRVTTWTALRAS
jgi:hypothetical protein